MIATAAPHKGQFIEVTCSGTPSDAVSCAVHRDRGDCWILHKMTATVCV